MYKCIICLQRLSGKHICALKSNCKEEGPLEAPGIGFSMKDFQTWPHISIFYILESMYVLLSQIAKEEVAERP